MDVFIARQKSRAWFKEQRYLYIICQYKLIARVAQSVERSAVNRKVGGSNPPVSEFLLL